MIRHIPQTPKTQLKSRLRTDISTFTQKSNLWPSKSLRIITNQLRVARIAVNQFTDELCPECSDMDEDSNLFKTFLEECDKVEGQLQQKAPLFEDNPDNFDYTIVIDDQFRNLAHNRDLNSSLLDFSRVQEDWRPAASINQHSAWGTIQGWDQPSSLSICQGQSIQYFNSTANQSYLASNCVNRMTNEQLENKLDQVIDVILKATSNLCHMHSTEILNEVGDKINHVRNKCNEVHKNAVIEIQTISGQPSNQSGDSACHSALSCESAQSGPSLKSQAQNLRKQKSVIKVNMNVYEVILNEMREQLLIFQEMMNDVEKIQNTIIKNNEAFEKLMKEYFDVNMVNSHVNSHQINNMCNINNNIHPNTWQSIRYTYENVKNLFNFIGNQLDELYIDMHEYLSSLVQLKVAVGFKKDFEKIVLEKAKVKFEQLKMEKGRVVKSSRNCKKKRGHPGLVQ